MCPENSILLLLSACYVKNLNETHMNLERKCNALTNKNKMKTVYIPIVYFLLVNHIFNYNYTQYYS